MLKKIFVLRGGGDGKAVLFSFYVCSSTWRGRGKYEMEFGKLGNDGRVGKGMGEKCSEELLLLFKLASLQIQEFGKKGIQNPLLLPPSTRLLIMFKNLFPSHPIPCSSIVNVFN